MVVARNAAHVIHVLGLGARQGHSVSVAIVVDGGSGVIGHTEWVAGVAAWDAKVGVFAGEVDSLAAVAYFNTV